MIGGDDGFVLARAKNIEKNVHYLQFETVDHVENVENVDKKSTFSTFSTWSTVSTCLYRLSGFVSKKNVVILIVPCNGDTKMKLLCCCFDGNTRQAFGVSDFECTSK